MTQTNNQRDPRLDPRVGDVVTCEKDARRVIKVELGAPLGGPGGVRARNITYVSAKRRGEHLCWISTWMEWCRANKVDVFEVGKDVTVGNVP